MKTTVTPQEVLENLGLSEGERKVYLSLLKIGESPVAKVKEDTGLHRTTIYDFLESLQQKGLVSAIKDKGTQHFSASQPERLLDFVNQTKNQVELILPTLQQLASQEQENIEVEVLRGVEGFKAAAFEALRHGQGIRATGIDEDQFMKTFPPHLMDTYFTRLSQLGEKDLVLTKESATKFYDEEYTEYRLVPDEYFSPSPIFTYADVVCIMTWEPLTIIRIKNEELADSHRKHFEFLWSIAKKR